jgi:pyruvate formate lyase activating enzyme
MPIGLSLRLAAAAANSMKIAGLVKSSLIDYPEKVAAVVFTQGCNFRCGFCHNPDLLSPEQSTPGLTQAEIMRFLQTRIGKLDGVVITGGEPLIQPDIMEFISDIRELGFLIKLDTNGSNPRLLSQLIEKNLVDYIAMDIKGPLAKYGEICAYVNTKFIQESIKIIKNSKLKYEFRTTVLPYYHELSDFEDIGRLISGARQYTIQGFRPQITLNPALREASSFTRPELDKISHIISPYVEKVVIHVND